jgi:hypothetical protein
MGVVHDDRAGGGYADASKAKFNAWRSIPSTFVRIAALRFPDMALAAGDRLESLNRVVLPPGEVLDEAHDEALFLRRLNDDGRNRGLSQSRERLQPPLRITRLSVGRRASGFVLVAKG